MNVLLENATLSTQREAIGILTRWKGNGLFSYVNREEGERPLVHRIMTMGNASGSLFSSFFISLENR